MWHTFCVLCFAVVECLVVFFSHIARLTELNNLMQTSKEQRADFYSSRKHQCPLYRYHTKVLWYLESRNELNTRSLILNCIVSTFWVTKTLLFYSILLIPVNSHFQSCLPGCQSVHWPVFNDCLFSEHIDSVNFVCLQGAASNNWTCLTLFEPWNGGTESCSKSTMLSDAVGVTTTASFQEGEWVHSANFSH